MQKKIFSTASADKSSNMFMIPNKNTADRILKKYASKLQFTV